MLNIPASVQSADNRWESLERPLKIHSRHVNLRSRFSTVQTEPAGDKGAEKGLWG